MSSREKIKTLEKVFIKETFCVASEGRSALGRRRREEKREPQRVVVVVVCESVFFLVTKKRRNGIIIIFNREEWLCLFERIEQSSLSETERKDDESKRARFGTDASGGEGNFYASVIVDDDGR